MGLDFSTQLIYNCDRVECDGGDQMSEKAKEILTNIVQETEELDERGRAFLEGYLTRAVQEAESKTEDKKGA